MLGSWLHFPLRNSSFPCFPFLLDPVSCVPAPAGKWGSMIQSIFLVFLLLRKHDSDLNNVECFWMFLEKKITNIIQLQSDQQNVQVLLNVWIEWDHPTCQSGNDMVSMREKFANQVSHVLGEVTNEQLSLFVCLHCWLLACSPCRLTMHSLQQFYVDCQLSSVSESVWKSKSLAGFSFSFNFPLIWRSFWNFQKESQNKEKEQEKRNSQNIGFSFSFWQPPTMERQKGKWNQGWDGKFWSVVEQCLHGTMMSNVKSCFVSAMRTNWNHLMGVLVGGGCVRTKCWLIVPVWLELVTLEWDSELSCWAIHAWNCGVQHQNNVTRKNQIVNKIAHFKSIFNEKGHNGFQNQEFWIAKNQKMVKINPKIPWKGGLASPSTAGMFWRWGGHPPHTLFLGVRELVWKFYQKPTVLC